MIARKITKRKWWILPAGLLVLIGLFFVLNKSPAYALDESGCLQCHGNAGLTGTDNVGQKVSLYVDQQSIDTGAHRYIDCVACHSAKPHDAGTSLTKESMTQLCGSCHQYEEKQYVQSIHGQQVAQGDGAAASCVDCHSSVGNPHSVMRTLEYTAPTYKKNIAATCAACHAQEDLMANYGIVEKVYESYMRSFHGKALSLGMYRPTELDKATCTNCHGAHDIKAVTDPSSPVAGLDNLSKTCESCHPGAGVQFAAGFLGHKEASPQNIPAAHYTEIIFSTLLITVVAFGVIIMLLAFRKFVAMRWKEKA